MFPNPKPFFDQPPFSGQQRNRNLRLSAERYPDRLVDVRHAKRVMQRIVMPADGTWAYAENQKSATTTTYAALYELTFGVKLSANMDENFADWADQSPQNLDKAQVFYQLAQFENSIEALDKAFRFSVVRNPVERAASSFHFICFTQKRSLRQFFADRVRMNVLGFDWDNDPYTQIGFSKFLHYVEKEAAMVRTAGRLADPHFRPQAMNMSLELLDPHLVFRVDDLAEGLDTLAYNLGRPVLAQETSKARLNAQPERQTYVSEMALIERVYADDFEIYESASLQLRKDWTIPNRAL